MIIQKLKPAVLVITGLTFCAMLSLISCNSETKKTETSTEAVDSKMTTPAPSTEDTSLLDTLTTRPVKTPD